MSNKKPPPLLPSQTRNRCPVCGEISYSRGGVHPQCSVRLADQKHKNQLKLEKPVPRPAKPANSGTPWHRVCPKCNALLHVRKEVCSCGYAFVRHAPSAGSDG